MSGRTSQPGGGLAGVFVSGDPWTDGLLFAAAGTAVAAVGGLVVWTAGAVLSLITWHGLEPTPGEALGELLDGGGLHGIWPWLPPALVVGFAFVLALAITAVGLLGLPRLRGAFPGRDGFAVRGQLASITPGRRAETTARRLRPGLTPSDTGRKPTRLAGTEVGVPLGRIPGTTRTARASWEDVVLAICAPRSGKTTCLAVPTILDAPGPVLVTSNKADVHDLTQQLRAGRAGGRVWLFDPQQVVPGSRQGFTWNPLAGLHTVADARRLAGHFIQEIRRADAGGDFWDRDAEDLLTGLLLAAAVARLPLERVGGWLTATNSVEPRNLLARAGFTQLAATMAGRSQGAHETREGVYATARAAAACLADPQIMAWVTPSDRLPGFDPAAFARSRETLYLLSKDGAGSAAPLVAAFADRLMLDAVRAAEVSPGGRLDPPLVAVLDEAANICRITELPRLYSHLGSRGVVPVTILQSRSQGRRVWGQAGMDELFSAATVKIIGAGIDDSAFAEDLSKLLGDHDITVTTHTTGRGGGTSRTTRRERVLPADQIRALPKFTALLLLTGIRPARLRLVPWMRGPHATAIRHALTAPTDGATSGDGPGQRS